MTNKYLIARIIGNDIETIHGSNQTYNNLLFTLKHESNFKDTDKFFILNRIIDKKKLNNIILLLKEFSYPYVIIPFNYNEYNKIPKLNEKTISLCERIILGRIDILNSRRKFILTNGLLNHRLYIMNINNARNECIKYGKSKGYIWTFVLDSNSYFTDAFYNDIIKNIKEDTEYITIPQIRLCEKGFTNNIILEDETKLIDLPLNEHQIAFKNTSKYTFNENIPYGTMNKGEFLNALGVKGMWNNWIEDITRLNIIQRKFENIKFQTLSKVIRLNPENINNKRVTNWINRFIGIYKIIQELDKNNIII